MTPPRAGAALAGALVSALAAASACDPVEPLARDDAGASDAGSGPDAGTLPQHDAGPPPEDAGPPADAGFPPDAGPTCVFDDNPIVPFACEGDEDFCAPVPDRPEPSGDLLAGWSRIEGDDVVIDLRFLAAPFRLATEVESIHLLFEHNTLPPYEGLSDHRDPLVSQSLWGGLEAKVGNSNYGECRGYPPPCVLVEPELPYDRCQVALGVESPVMRVRVPIDLAANADGTVRYAVAIAAPDPLGYNDTNWFGGPKHFETPQGGAPDGVDDLLGICDMDCSDGALP